MPEGRAARTAPAPHEVRRDIPYATRDSIELCGDLYLPDGPGPFAILVGVHGGAWQAGSRELYRHWGPYLARHGYALFAIDYRLAGPGRATYPHAVWDVRAAVRFVRSGALGPEMDRDRIGLMGDSAGAHLAALVALAGDALPFAADPDATPDAVTSGVRAVVGVYGVYDLEAQWRHDQLARPFDQITQTFLGAPPMQDRRLFFEASPLGYATFANNRVAFLLAYGTTDDVVDPATQSQAFLAALKQARFLVRTVVLQGAPHFWIADPIDEPASHTGFLAPRLLRFLGERL